MPATPYVITTARLGLRHYRLEDAPALGPVFTDPYAARFYPAMNQPEAWTRWITWNLQNYDTHGFGLWALELLATGQFVGDAGITWQTVESERLPEIGWHIHPSFRAQGLATEAGLACRDYGFATLKCATLSSIVDPANAASIKVAERVHAARRSYLGKAGPMWLYYTLAPGLMSSAMPQTHSS